ncbi:MAG: type II secretion system F family protein [Firmicutes bacterium]|nr:type II secretion system F family protein [Bacillota bacterium]
MNDYSVYKPSVKERIMICVAVLLILELIGLLVYDTKLGGILILIAYPFLEIKYKSIMIKRRKNKLRNQFRDMLYSMSSAFATGDHMAAAMEKSITALEDIYGEANEMSTELALMINKINETGEDEKDLWCDFGRRSGVEDIRDFAEVFSSCRDAGGNIVRMVDRAAEMMNEKIGVENEIRIMASQKVAEGRLVGIMPIFMIVFLRLTSPSYMRVMYESIAGRILMTVSMLITIAAFLVTEKVTAIEV